jgi:biopolymer transport protein ExbD
MAEVGGGDGKARPRIDMTPMVDLGFLLLTFFVLTTTMNTPTAMPIFMPPKQNELDKTPPDKVAASKVLILLIAEENRVYYYQGAEGSDAIEMNRTEFSPRGTGVRSVILEYKEKIRDKWKSAKDDDPMIILIKFADESRYKNFVDILDEMNITKRKKYIIDKITKEEIQMIADYKKNQGA